MLGPAAPPLALSFFLYRLRRAVGAAAPQPDGKGSSARGGPGQDSDWLCLDPYPVLGQSLWPTWGHMSNPAARGRSLGRKERRGAEPGDPGLEWLQGGKEPGVRVHAGSLCGGFRVFLQPLRVGPMPPLPAPRPPGFGDFLGTAIYLKYHFEKS